MNWERLARANTHPLRISILEALAIDRGRTLSPSDLSHELSAPLSNVNYHVNELARSGLIELTAERPARGAIEHFYRLAEGTTLGPEEGNGPARQGPGGPGASTPTHQMARATQTRRDRRDRGRAE